MKNSVKESFLLNRNNLLSPVKILGAWEEAYNHRYIPYGGKVVLTAACTPPEPYCPEEITGGEMTFKVQMQFRPYSIATIDRVKNHVDGREAHYSGIYPALNTAADSVNGVYTIRNVHWGADYNQASRATGLHIFTINLIDSSGNWSAEWRWYGGYGL